MVCQVAIASAGSCEVFIANGAKRCYPLFIGYVRVVAVVSLHYGSSLKINLLSPVVFIKISYFFWTLFRTGTAKGRIAVLVSDDSHGPNFYCGLVHFLGFLSGSDTASVFFFIAAHKIGNIITGTLPARGGVSGHCVVTSNRIWR
jgi:hypothetical protein